jgi:adenine deaminase
VRDPAQDVVKLTVVERHNGTGNVSCALLGGYGLKCGAIATTIAHDSHNILVVGADDDEMYAAVNAIIEQEGGVVLVKDGEVIEQMPLPIAGLMTNRSGKWVEKKLEAIHEKAHTELGVNKDIEPVMTLCFMALPVIPEIKVTDKGLFDVTNFSFIPIEAQ